MRIKFVLNELYIVESDLCRLFYLKFLKDNRDELMPLFCAKCGGNLKPVNDGYKCTNCGKKYPQSKYKHEKKYSKK